jgi:hypothetical protein
VQKKELRLVTEDERERQKEREGGREREKWTIALSVVGVLEVIETNMMWVAVNKSEEKGQRARVEVVGKRRRKSYKVRIRLVGRLEARAQAHYVKARAHLRPPTRPPR